MATRRTDDCESADRAISFMERVRDTKPFFLYYPITQIHFADPGPSPLSVHQKSSTRRR